MKRDDAHPVGTIQCNDNSIVTVATNFAESGDYILFNNGQLFASCVSVNNALKSTVADRTCRTPNDGLYSVLAPLLRIFEVVSLHIDPVIIETNRLDDLFEGSTEGLLLFFTSLS